ncbi:unnamed protein product [Auanema sp. JU1783]|nr:unnamed protein product [Auanema sp. JU1783]
MVQDLFFEVVRRKQHIFCNVKDNAPVSDLKKMIEGILKIPVTNQILLRFTEDGNYSNYVQLDDKKSFTESGFTAVNAKAQAPAQIGLLLKGESEMVVESLSSPPPIPDAMRAENPQE